MKILMVSVLSFFTLSAFAGIDSIYVESTDTGVTPQVALNEAYYLCEFIKGGYVYSDIKIIARQAGTKCQADGKNCIKHRTFDAEIKCGSH